MREARPESSRLVLASASAARRGMLERAGVAVEVLPARVDESGVKAAMLAEGAPPRDIADALADLKARRVAAKRPEAFVLGADQVLVCEGRMLDKPLDRAAATDQLLALRGRTHELLSAAVIWQGGAPVWRHVGQAVLTMRPFSDAFLDAYLDAEGGSVTETVGAYRIEGRGAQLFARVEGDHFTILGLPLLPLLAYLRERGLVAS